jgi:predicted phosphodiesterase
VAGEQVNLADALEATAQHDEPRHDRPNHPKGWEPGYEWNGTAGSITTAPLAEAPKSWDHLIRDAGHEPADVEIVGPIQHRGWDVQQKGGNVVRLRYYRINVQRRALKQDIDDLVKAAKRKLQKSNIVPATAQSGKNATSAFLVALGDLQLGKMDGDGVEGTVARFLDKTADAVARYKALKKPGPIYLTHLGDCIEGMVSQGGANQWRTTLTVTEQVRLYRRLLIEQVKAFSSVTDRLVVAGIPGNHDEANRPLHTYGDSWAIDALAAVKDALDLAGNYDHVTVVAPARDELTLTLDMAGTIVGLAHGHQWRAGQHVTWWAKQAHGRQPIGDAHLLLSGHLHHLRVEQTGSDKTFIQAPAIESGSQWWKHRTGEWGQPGIVTAVVGGGTWRSLEIL